MAQIEFRVKVIKTQDGLTTGTLLDIDGSVDASTIHQFQQVMDKLVEKGVRNLIIDCTNVKYINSTGLGTLLKYSDSFESIGGHIAFCRVPSKVMLVMEMLGFNALFDIVPDEAAALRSFAGKTPASAAPAAPAPQTTPVAVAAPTSPAPVSAAAPGAGYPQQSCCAGCHVTLEIPAAGKFKCPRCGEVLDAQPNGRITFFTDGKKGQPIAVSVPCNSEMAESMAHFAAKCAGTLGFNGNAAESISSAISAACKNVMERAYENKSGSAVHLLIVPNGASLTLKISDYGKAFDFGTGGTIQNDSRFAPVIASMDTVEHRANPSGGNLLTMVKLLKK